jgi:hypothetical protein
LTVCIDGAKPFATEQEKASALIMEIFMVSGLVVIGFCDGCRMLDR